MGGLGASTEISIKLSEMMVGCWFFNFVFSFCLFLPPGICSRSACVAYLMEPRANEVSGPNSRVSVAFGN